jgi:hypothetical protein
MTRGRRIALKVAWMAALLGMLVLFGQVRHVFIYQAF